MSDTYWGGDLDLGLTVGNKRLILREEQRFLHTHVLGLSGKGKTSFLTSLIRQDILNGQGVCVIDPHGSLYHDSVEWCAAYGLHRQRKIRLFNPQSGWNMGLNPLRTPPGHHVSGTVDAVMRAMSTVWADEDFFKTPRLQRILQWICYVLATSGYTLYEAIDLLRSQSTDVRQYLMSLSAERAGDPITHRGFAMVGEELAGMRPQDFREQVESSFNRFFSFLSTPVINAIVGQREHPLNVHDAMDRGEVLLVNLAPADHLGFSSDRARFVGNLLVNDFFTTALGRKPNVSRPYYLYIDEAYDFLNKDVEKILDQARKFGLHLIIFSHQRLAQLRDKSEAVASGVIAGAQTKVIFGLGRGDAEEMGYELFASSFDLEKPKESLRRPTAVGQQLVRLKSYSRSQGRSAIAGRTAGTAESEGDAESVSEGETFSEMEGSSTSTSIGETESFSFVDSDGQISAWGGSQVPSGVSRAEAESESAGSSTGRSQSSAYSRGTFRGRSTSESETTAEGTSESETEGEAESYRTIYENLPTATFSLEELKHMASNELFELERRQAYVRVPDHEPVKIIADFVEPSFPDPECLEEWITERHTTDEYTVASHVIEQELVERPEVLKRLALQVHRARKLKSRAEELDLDPNDLAS